MLITGQFRTIKNELCTVKILSDGDDSTTKTIGEDGLFFAEDPVTIETDCDNTLEHLIRKSCSINLVCDDYIGDSLWASNARNIIVNIKKGNQTVFAGYVEPNSFNQPFAKPLEEFTINCIDAISTLQYYKYKNATLRNYDDIKKNASSATFKEMLQQMFADIIDNLNIDGNSEPKLIYDCSKAVTQGYQKTTFATLAMDESFLLGEEFDDCWTNEEILEEMLRYLNLHIVQDGFNFFIYDWNTIKNGRNVWYDVLNDSNFTLRTPSTVTLTSAMHGADDTNISVDDVYNQFQVKCELENEDVVIESPLEDKSITSLYNGRQLYCREYYCEKADKVNLSVMLENFWRMLKGRSTQYTYEHGKLVDWYIQAINNPKWLMHLNNGEGNITDVYPISGGHYVNQWSIAKYVKDNRLTPAMFKFGKIDLDAQNADNEPKSGVSMNDYLYISINGNDSDEYLNSQPTPIEIETHAPMIEYVSGSSGKTFSPSDDDTTNYLVFSGKIQLQTRQEETNNYQFLIDHSGGDEYDSNSWTLYCLAASSKGLVDIKDTNKYDSDPNDYKGRLYTRKFYTFEEPNVLDTDETQYLKYQTALQPPAESKLKLFYYEYTEPIYWRDNEDLITKLPLLECELIIGNKRLIETDIDKYGNSTFQWVRLGEEPTFVYEDDGETYTVTTFTLGVNPKIKDYIIGQEYNIQNTIKPSMNLDNIKGTAIPITKEDAISGAVQFRILGPVNNIWNHVIRKHPSFWRHTSWIENNRVVLAHVENIILKDFECKIATNGAGKDYVGENNDLIYMSDETDKFINKNDSTTFKFITQLTSEEAISKGVKNGFNINAVQNTLSETSVSTIYDYTTQETAKPEEHYVNQYYLEYCQPRIKMEATMHDDIINWRNRYTSNVLNRTFFIQSTNVNLKYNNAEVTFKEI